MKKEEIQCLLLMAVILIVLFAGGYSYKHYIKPNHEIKGWYYYVEIDRISSDDINIIFSEEYDWFQEVLRHGDRMSDYRFQFIKTKENQSIWEQAMINFANCRGGYLHSLKRKDIKSGYATVTVELINDDFFDDCQVKGILPLGKNKSRVVTMTIEVL
jgi:hypothetical protein